jgi:tripartite-type tricarboxylate transporter receptor subunit TctC
MVFARIAVGLLIALSVAAPRAFAADDAAGYPSRPVRVIVPQQAGSSSDAISRVMAAKLGDVLGQQFVVDNRAGAGGLIGMELGAQAAPDGYTVIAAATGPVAVAPHTYSKLNYDPFNDFAPISLFAITQNMLVVNAKLPVQNVKELIALAKAKPGTLNLAYAGSGSQSHLAGVMFAQMAGIQVVNVAYKGAGSSVAAVASGEAQFTINPTGGVIGQVRGGFLRALGVTGEKRSPGMPDIPTVAEAGLPGYVNTGWVGLIAPKNTPQPILGKLHDALVKVAGLPDTKEQLERQAGEVATDTPAEFAKFLRAEYTKFGAVVKAANLKVE